MKCNKSRWIDLWCAQREHAHRRQFLFKFDSSFSLHPGVANYRWHQHSHSSWIWPKCDFNMTPKKCIKLCCSYVSFDMVNLSTINLSGSGMIKFRSVNQSLGRKESGSNTMGCHSKMKWKGRISCMAGHPTYLPSSSAGTCWLWAARSAIHKQQCELVFRIKPEPRIARCRQYCHIIAILQGNFRPYAKYWWNSNLTFSD
jgi:hypothetical protein